MFGIAAEFFHQPVGTGALQADYKLGEDMIGFGPIRAADVPASLDGNDVIDRPDHRIRITSAVRSAIWWR